MFTFLLGLALLPLLGAVLFAIDAQAAAAPISVVTTTETIAATSFALTTPNPNGKCVVRAWLQLTVGASTTGVTIAVYRGNAIGGPVVGTKQLQAGDFAPSGTSDFSVEFLDPFSNVVGVQYCVSVLQTGATGNGTIQNALIHTEVLSG